MSSGTLCSPTVGISTDVMYVATADVLVVACRLNSPHDISQGDGVRQKRQYLLQVEAKAKEPILHWQESKRQ
jgi:hypothetical protein